MGAQLCNVKISALLYEIKFGKYFFMRQNILHNPHSHKNLQHTLLMGWIEWALTNSFLLHMHNGLSPPHIFGACVAVCVGEKIKYTKTICVRCKHFLEVGVKSTLLFFYDKKRL